MTFYRTFFATALIALPLLAVATDGDSVRTKDKDLFVLKTERKFAGAKVEVFTNSGQLVTAQKVEGRKVIIDFGSTEYGTYTIKVSKGDRVKEFEYIRK